jgi:hypothetical protein
MTATEEIELRIFGPQDNREHLHPIIQKACWDPRPSPPWFSTTRRY